MATRARHQGRSATANPRKSPASAKSSKPRGGAKPGGLANPRARAANAKAPAASFRVKQRAAGPAASPGVVGQAAQHVARVESALGAVEAALGRLEKALARFADDAARLDGGLERLTGAARELETWLRKPAGAAEKLQGHAVNIEAKLERFTVDNRRALDLLGLKLDRVVNALGELRRTISPPSHRPAGSFA